MKQLRTIINSMIMLTLVSVSMLVTVKADYATTGVPQEQVKTDKTTINLTTIRIITTVISMGIR